MLDEEPIFPEKLVELALWCADYYICSAGEIFKMIGPKESLKKRISYEAAIGEGPKNLKADAKKIHDALKKPLSAATLAGKTGIALKDMGRLVKPLIKKGAVVKHEEFYLTSSKVTPFKWEKVDVRAVDKIPEKSHTPQQLKVIEKISGEIKQKRGKTTLLRGVTGSGKTQVYIALCKKALVNGGGAIVLVPEIALTYQLVKRFYACFGRNIALLHSGLTPAQRRDEWMRVQKGRAQLVIGARSAIFAPIRNLKLIVVDEEHDPSYKQTESPRYNARDVAVVLGRITGAAVLLGSATPSLESFYNANSSGKYGYCEMNQRIDARPMPTVRIVAEPDDESKPLTSEIIEEIIKRLDRKEQSLIFMNRRGLARYVTCLLCRSAVECPNCSVTLTCHMAGGRRLICHYCGFDIPEPETCPSCKAGKIFSKKGIGTQKLESFIRELFPKSKVDRLDRDNAPDRKRVFKILENFEKGLTDILIGTQMTAKGHDFSNLTFSAIVGADDYLSFPDFRSAERTFALITQAVGRTGRGDKGGEVIVVGSDSHYAVKNALTQNYEAFYNEEILMRKATAFPPFSRLTGILFDCANEKFLENAMDALKNSAPKLPAGVKLLGPAPALIYKLRNRYRWKLLLKGKSPKSLRLAALEIEKSVNPRVSVSIDVDPVGFY